MSWDESRAMIPHNENPFAEQNYYPGFVDERPPPTLTVVDLDRLVAARIADARSEWVSELRQAQMVAWERGRQAGTEHGRRGVAETVTRAIRGRLAHTERKLRDRGERKKTTIADERKFIAEMGLEVNAAIIDLCKIEGVDG